MTNWDQRFLELAKHISAWSKDPSTKVGAVIVSPDRVIKSLGYNGFPRGVEDRITRLLDRETKLRFMCHAELNAILNTNSDVVGCTIYSYPLFTCNECAKAIIQAGIIRVVSPPPLEERYKSLYEVAQQMYKEAGVEVVTI